MGMKKMLVRLEEHSPETKLPKLLPKNGAVCAQLVRCGRPGCRCERGELHGPYHYLFWREHGQLHKQYVKMAEVAEVRTICDARREREQQMRELARESWKQWRAIKAQLREVYQSG